MYYAFEYESNGGPGPTAMETRKMRGGNLNGRQLHYKQIFDKAVAEIDPVEVCGEAGDVIFCEMLTDYLAPLNQGRDKHASCTEIDVHACLRVAFELRRARAYVALCRHSSWLVDPFCSAHRLPARPTNGRATIRSVACWACDGWPPDLSR